MNRVLIAGIRMTRLDVFHTWLNGQPYTVQRARNLQMLRHLRTTDMLIVVDEFGEQSQEVVNELIQTGHHVLTTSEKSAKQGQPHLAWPFTKEQFLDQVESLLHKQTTLNDLR